MLKIARTTSFDSSIDETFMTSHTVKVEFLRLQPHQKMTGDESASNGHCFEGFEVPLAMTGTWWPSSSCCLRAEEIWFALTPLPFTLEDTIICMWLSGNFLRRPPGMQSEAMHNDCVQWSWKSGTWEICFTCWAKQCWWRYLMTVAFIPNLTKSSRKNQTMFYNKQNEISRQKDNEQMMFIPKPKWYWSKSSQHPGY